MTRFFAPAVPKKNIVLLCDRGFFINTTDIVRFILTQQTLESDPWAEEDLLQDIPIQTRMQEIKLSPYSNYFLSYLVKTGFYGKSPEEALDRILCRFVEKNLTSYEKRYSNVKHGKNREC